MRTTARLSFTLAFVFLFSVSVIAPVRAEEQFPGTISHTNEPVKDEHVKELERKQAKARNKERQEDIKKDTDKLLQLATELKLYVDKTNENVLSLDVIKKAEQIEKLSKEIQKKMKAE